MTAEGYYGYFGGRFVPEMLRPALDELEEGYRQFQKDREFNDELSRLYTTYAGRPTPLYRADNLAGELAEAGDQGGLRVYLKLESLNHTGAHKINNALGQALLAKKMGKTHLVAETGAGQHGLATATVAARFGLGCTVYMGEVDVARQHPNVYAMKLLGAEVVPVSDGSRTLKDAVNAAMKHWISRFSDTHYLLGSALGPHPFPEMVRNFQSIIGREAREQILAAEGRLPTLLAACVGGGSNALGLFHPFLEDSGVRMVGIEAGGRGPEPGENALRFTPRPRTGIIQGYRSFFIMDEDGQVGRTHSVSAGLDYPGVGPELAHLYRRGRVEFSSADDDTALEGFRRLARSEGILPALESSHAVGWLLSKAPSLEEEDLVIVNISGRGDKDVFITAPMLDGEDWRAFLRSQCGLKEAE